MASRKKVKIGKVSINSPAILGFTAICVAALILDYLTDGWTNNHIFSVYRASFGSLLTYVRFIGHVFGHANLSHFLGNIMIILIVGPLLEEKYGSDTICIVVILTAIITGIIHFIIFPHTRLLGASGVVFAFILMSSFTSIKAGEIPLTFILVAFLYLGEQVYDGLFIKDNISNLTHIVGGVVGAACGFVYAPTKKR